jgi:hypothetical protein
VTSGGPAAAEVDDLGVAAPEVEREAHQVGVAEQVAAQVSVAFGRL